MKKFLISIGFLFTMLFFNSCRQNDIILSNEDVTNLKIIQDTRVKREQTNNTKKDSLNITTFKQEELVRPPR